MHDATNPLSSYFRAPGIHVKLPSRGAFTPPNELELSMDGELAVYPMTTRDEIWAKNPDGLLNGTSIEHIIRSCVPGIRNPRTLPAQDVDFLLLAIKKVTYGNTMTITSTCPKCGTEHNFECGIDDILANVTPYAPDNQVRVSDDFIVNLRPYDYYATTRTNLASFEEAKLIHSLIDAGLDEAERVHVFGRSFNKISNLNLDLLSDAVVNIQVKDQIVTDRNHIKEWVANAPLTVINKIEEAMKLFLGAGVDRKIGLSCPVEECKNEWISELTFDPAHFFE